MTSYSDKPSIMAIGDSMYQGVRSLTFTADLARYSPPAQVAGQIGRTMTVPNPRVPILFDLESLFRKGSLLHLLASIRETSIENMKFWLSSEIWSQHEAFDNVAIGGAAIDSLYTDTYGSYWPKVAELSAKLKQNSMPDPKVIGGLWYALNVCFTLNPQQRDEQANKTQIDQVIERKPEILLVNIGSNEGLFHAAFAGAFDSKTIQSVKDIPKKMEELARLLASLPKEVETIIFNSLIRPRTASNLMTREDFPPYPKDGGYFDEYVPRIGPKDDIPGSVIKDFDEIIHDVNGQVKGLMQTKIGSRLKFVDLYSASTGYDGKHYQDRYLEVRPDGGLQRLRNVPINTTFGWLHAGGLTGLDNMHPTVPGYALIADAVLKCLSQSAPLTDKEAAYKNDSLLNNLPWSWAISELELSLLGTCGVFATGAPLG